MAAKTRSKKRKLNNWFYAAFSAAAIPFISLPVLKIMEGDADMSSMAATIIFTSAAGFAGFGTTGAIKNGQFFMEFYTADKHASRISFWSCAVFGYIITGVFIALSIL